MAKGSIFDIDPDRLDYEWLRQASLYAGKVEEFVAAIEDHDTAQRRLKAVVSEMDVKIRERPNRYGLEKATEAAVKNAIPGTKEYRKAEKEFLETRRRKNLLEGHLEALQHKKRALEKLVDLHGRNYFGDPRADTEDGRKGVEKVRKGRKDGMRDR